jgi:hypothetical protein
MELDRYKARPGKEVDKSWFDRSTRKLTHTEEVMKARLMEAEALEVQAKKLKLEADRARAEIEALRRRRENEDPQAKDEVLERAMDSAATRLSVLQDEFKAMEQNRLLQEQREKARMDVNAADARARQMRHLMDEAERSIPEPEGAAASEERARNAKVRIENLRQAAEHAEKAAEKSRLLLMNLDSIPHAKPPETPEPTALNSSGVPVEAMATNLLNTEMAYLNRLATTQVSPALDAVVRRTASLPVQVELLREKDTTISDLTTEVHRLREKLAELGPQAGGVGPTSPVNKSK